MVYNGFHYAMLIILLLTFEDDFYKKTFLKMSHNKGQNT